MGLRQNYEGTSFCTFKIKYDTHPILTYPSYRVIKMGPCLLKIALYSGKTHKIKNGGLI